MSGATPVPAVKEEVVQLAVERISPNPLQPRRSFSAARIRSLAQSIAQQGVIQPLVVRPHPRDEDRYQLVAGERRLRAVRLLGWAAAPALVRSVPDENLLEAALVENLQREQLTPIEEAQALRDLMERHGYTQDMLARRIGRDRSTIANLVRLLALPVSLQEDLEAERLTVGHARALLPLEDTVLQLGLRNEILRRGLSVRDTERLVRRQASGGRANPEPAPDAEREAGAEAYGAVAESLERRFGTKVTVRRHGRHEGSVELAFYSLDDFNRLFDLLMGRGG